MKKKKGSKNKDAPMTILIIPSSPSRTRHLQLTRRTIQKMVLGVALFLCCITIMTCVYVSDWSDIKRIHQVQQASRDKDATIKRLNAEIDAIDKQQDAVIAKQKEIRKLMGLKDSQQRIEEPSRGGGQGGQDRILPQESASDNGKTLAEIKNNLSREEKELADLFAQVKNDQAYFRAVPNQWPAEGSISSEYGERTSPFNRQTTTFHTGLDIANNTGVEVLAAGDGTVTFAGWMPVYGRTILIDHGYGLESKYGHNSALLVNEGERVKKGDEIAKLGNTGSSTGPHLHFTILKDGQTQDPRIYLP